MDLHKEHRTKASNQRATHGDTMSVKLVSLITDSISDAVFAEVKQATRTNSGDTCSEMGESQSSKRKADSGSLGSFIKSRRTNTSGANESS